MGVGRSPPDPGLRRSAALWIFLALLIAGSIALNVAIVSAGGIRKAGVLVVGMMCLPAVSALVALLIANRSLRGIGWGVGRAAFLAIAIALPMLIVTPVYAVLWLTGEATLVLSEWQKLVTENFGVTLGVIPSLLLIASAGLLLDAIVAAGEEIGWRGFLLPALMQRFTVPLAAMLTAAIWAVWHWPGILFGGYSSAATPTWFNILCFTAMALGWGMVLAWLRVKSGSVWPAALMHGAHNILVQAILDPVTHDAGGATPYITGEFGAGLAFTYAIAGVIAWRALARPASPSTATTP